MEKKGWKQIAMGTVVSIAGITLTSCENENEKQENKEKAKTEQVVNEMSKQGISVFKKGAENAPDSVLESVDVLEPFHQYNSVQYSNPKYRAKTYNDFVDDVHLGASENKGVVLSRFDVDNMTAMSASSKEKIDEIKAKLKAGEDYHGLKMAEDKPTGSVKTQTFEYDSPELSMAWKSDDKVQTNTEYSFQHSREYESTVYNGDDGTVEVEFEFVGGETYNFENPNEERVSASQSRPEKKEPPKGSISKDAFINALLEQKRGRGGKKS